MLKTLSKKIKLKVLTPFLVEVSKKGISITLSERFVMFQLLGQLHSKLEESPYLNFLSLLSYQKSFERTLSESVEKFYKKRNSYYFKRFFKCEALYLATKREICEVYKINKTAKLTIFKSGLLVYDNYNVKAFNVLLLTLHAGVFVPKELKSKSTLSKREQEREDDIYSDTLYRNIVLKQGGIWITNKMSRFYCDLNRSKEECIYDSLKTNTLEINLWKKPLTKKERREILGFYDEFYLLLGSVIEAYAFNIIFDGHTMRHEKTRPSISFGTHYIPKFYLPIVASLKKKIMSMGYESCAINTPYGGGYILAWISKKYPAVFTFSMEINKKIYLYPDRLKTKPKNIEKISNDLVEIFDIQEEEGYRFRRSGSKS